MKIQNCLKFLVALAVIITACSPDDPDFVPVPDRDRGEQQATDDALLQEYFNTHYYNKAEIEAQTNIRVDDIIITQLLDGESVPEGHALLQGNVISKTAIVQETNYTYYILKLNQGAGDASPNFTDKVRVTYEGSLVDTGDVFDSAVTPVDFDLVGVSAASGVIRGWSLVFPEFNEALDFSSGPDGISYNDYGVGVMFLPSGLAYFSSALVGIPAYSNLVFKFTLFQTQENDHDNDGVPSYLEDLNNNFDVFDDNTDEDIGANFIDNDDDGDGVLTINEDLDGDGDPTNDDSDGDGIPNYLDEDSTDSNEDS